MLQHHKGLAFKVALFSTLLLTCLLTKTSVVNSSILIIRPPFNIEPNGSSYRLTSYFDHAYPDYGQYDGVTIYDGENSANFSPYSYQGHPGYDWAMDFNTPILAAADGVISRIVRNCEDPGPCPSLGNRVCIRHSNGIYSLYAHLTQVNVEANDIVTAGQVIGLSGNTGTIGPHLHFGVYLGPSCLYGNEANPVDPYGWQGNYPDPQQNLPGAAAGANSPCLWRSFPSDPISCADTITEDMGRLFNTIGNWTGTAFGNGYHEYHTHNTSINDNVTAYWNFSINSVTPAEVFVWIPEGTLETPQNEFTQNATYEISTTAGLIPVTIDQSAYSNQWVSLGNFTFSPTNYYIILRAYTGETAGSKWVMADSVKLRKYRSVFPAVKRSPTCANYDELVLNGTFENGINYWNADRIPGNNVNFVQPRSGGGSALKLGGSVNMMDYAQQSILIPDEGCQVTLSFENWILSDEASSTTRYDLTKVFINGDENSPLLELGNDSPRGVVVNYTYDLSQYRGQTVLINFKSINDGSYLTSFWYDNVSVKSYRD
jgi:hypothetical protein